MSFGKTAPDHKWPSFSQDPGCGLSPLTPEAGESSRYQDLAQAWGTSSPSSAQTHGDLVLAQGQVHTPASTDQVWNLTDQGICGNVFSL